VVTYKLSLPIALVNLPKYLVIVVHFVTRRKIHLVKCYEEIFDVSYFENYFGESKANDVSKTEQKIHKLQFRFDVAKKTDGYIHVIYLFNHQPLEII